MKAILSFDLTKEDEQSAFNDACEGSKLRAALWDYDQWLRDQIKYHDKNELQIARDQLYEILNDQNLRIDE